MLVKYLPVLNETLRRNTEIKVSFLHAMWIQEAFFPRDDNTGISRK
jgi:hypothetical protein